MREQVARAANAALDGDLTESDAAAVEDAVGQMAVAVRRSSAATLAD
jgi:hypothetical protein